MSLPTQDQANAQADRARAMASQNWRALPFICPSCGAGSKACIHTNGGEVTCRYCSGIALLTRVPASGYVQEHYTVSKVEG